jgi:hypothetical protein
VRLVVLALLVAALAAGCDHDRQTYSRSDVERAFRSQGLELLAPNRESPQGVDGLVSAPRTADGQFVVLIYPDEKEATNSLRILRSQARSETFDVRKKNVVVTSDEGVTAPMRKRIRAALAQLS